MSKSIRPSPKHGVNPSLDQCFYCLKDKGVILFGRIQGDNEAPKRVCLDRAPCNECAELMRKGIILISVDEARSTDQSNPYRTGGWVVVKEDFVKRAIQGELGAVVLKQRIAFVPDDAWNMLGLPSFEPCLNCS